MNIPEIILTVILGAIVLLAAFFFISMRINDKKAQRYDVVGTTTGWQKSKLPFLGRVVIQYTRRGKPFAVGSSLMFKPKKLKIGAQNRWTVFVYRVPGKDTVMVAKRYKGR